MIFKEVTPDCPLQQVSKYFPHAVRYIIPSFPSPPLVQSPVETLWPFQSKRQQKMHKGLPEFYENSSYFNIDQLNWLHSLSFSPFLFFSFIKLLSWIESAFAFSFSHFKILIKALGNFNSNSLSRLFFISSSPWQSSLPCNPVSSFPSVSTTFLISTSFTVLFKGRTFTVSSFI